MPADQLLRNIPMFRELTDQEIAQLKQIAIERSYRKKTVIFHEGAERESVYLLLEGLVKTFKTNEQGHEHIVSILKKGDLFPHTGFFSGGSYPGTAETFVDVKLFAFPIQSFERLLLSTPTIAMKVMNVMSEKIRELQTRLQELTGQDVHQRCISFLIDLAENYGVEKNGEIWIHVPMTHSEFAGAVGSSRETVNRLMNQLRKAGILEMSRRGYIVKDPDRLKAWREV